MTRRLNYLLVAQLHHVVQVLKGLLLSILCFAQLFNQVRLDAFELIHFVLDLVDHLLPIALLQGVLSTDLFLHLSLLYAFKLLELSLMYPNLLSLFTLPLYIKALFADALLVASLLPLHDQLLRPLFKPK